MIKFHLFPVALAACLLAIGFFSSVACVDPLKAAEISREIREHYRQSGMNWISPRQLLEQIDLSINTKPIMYVFTLRSCQDCRTLMNEFVTEQGESGSGSPTDGLQNPWQNLLTSRSLFLP